ncbi:MAG: ATP-binding cassette domain-containing protein, partial [Roseinatronobacter sp.]
VGYFAQHQIDELDADATPLQHLTKARPEASKAWARSRLAGFGLTADQVETTAIQLSGGEKARLSLLLATLDAPHLLILDEPTNHLDIEGRDALVEALTQYTGAIILVSHDMHLLGLVADRLWLVQGGAVTPYEDDLEAYRAQMLHPPAAPVEKPKTVPPVRMSRSEIVALRADVRKCETRLAKLNEMRDQLAVKLSDPGLYEPDMGTQADIWQKKYAEVMDGLERGEALWTEAMAKLEQALAQAT